MIRFSRMLGVGMLLLALILPVTSVQATRWQLANTLGITNTEAGLQLSADAPQPAAVYGAYSRFGMVDFTPQSTNPTRQVDIVWTGSTTSDAKIRVDVRIARAGRWSDWTLDVQSGQSIRFDRIGTQIQARATLLANSTSPVLNELHLYAQPLSSDDQAHHLLQDPLAPTYHIRATRMGLIGDRTANGHIIQPNDWFVSLPSFRSLSSLGGSEYMARLSYNGRSIVVPVWEVGPWNIHDDYWNIDRERFSDLPVGWPQDHAAYYDNYNGGWAEKGYVRFPTAADVGDGAWTALGIPFNEEQEEIDITFLWLGSDPGANPSPIGVGIWNPPAPEPVPAGTIQVDTHENGFNRSNAPWYSHDCGQSNSALWTYSTTNPEYSTNTGTWTSEPWGSYEVKAFIPYCINGKHDTTSARYVIRHRDGETSITVNQANHAGSWVSLGRYEFAGWGQVYLSDLTGDSWNSVWFDAIRWQP